MEGTRQWQGIQTLPRLFSPLSLSFRLPFSSARVDKILQLTKTKTPLLGLKTKIRYDHRLPFRNRLKKLNQNATRYATSPPNPHPTTLINAQPHQQPTGHTPGLLAAGKSPRPPAVPRDPVDAAAGAGAGRQLHPVAAAAAAVAAAHPSPRLSDDWSGADCGSRLGRRGHRLKR